MNSNQDLIIKAEGQLSIYLELIKLLSLGVSTLKTSDKADFTNIKDKIIEMIAILKENNRMLMGFANTPYSVLQRKGEINEDDANIVQYGINLAIYSAALSIQIGVPDEHLPYIAMTSLCNHLGMISANSSEKDSKDMTATSEFSKKSLMENISKISISNFDMDSLVFLSGLLNNNKHIIGRTSVQETMYQYAIMISLCSSYEKLTHKKVRGEFIAPAIAMKSLRDEINNYFNRNVIKIFFNLFSIYPVGTFVRLSTKETAKIVDINQGLIMRPIVTIVVDPDGLEKNPPSKINLKEKPNLYIKHSITDDMLSEKYLMLF
jgi:hypothetical protein